MLHGATRMRAFRSLIKAVVVLLMAGAFGTLHAQDGLGDAFLRLNSSRDFSTSIVGPTIATADFNNDTYPDGAVLVRSNNRFQIEVHFRYRRVSRLTFASSLPRLAISALDVNNDGNTDLVVEEPFSRQRLFVWLNDGYGSFHSAHVEDYPAQSEDGYRSFTDPSEGPQNRAIVVAAKSRLRVAWSRLVWLPASADPVCFPRQSTSHFLEFRSTPNLFRGPPSSILL